MLAKATGTPIQNITIANNTIVSPRTAAIGVACSKNAQVVGNRIENPMAAGLQTARGKVENYEHPSAILLNTVESVLVAENQIAINSPQLLPEVSWIHTLHAVLCTDAKKSSYTAGSTKAKFSNM